MTDLQREAPSQTGGSQDLAAKQELGTKYSTCIACGGPGPLRTPTGHPACFDCLLTYNVTDLLDWLNRRSDVTDVTDVTADGGSL